MTTRPTLVFSSWYWAVLTEATPPRSTRMGEATPETSPPDTSTTSRGGSWSLKTV